jgi:hypothetical protein
VRSVIAAAPAGARLVPAANAMLGILQEQARSDAEPAPAEAPARRARA